MLMLIHTDEHTCVYRHAKIRKHFWHACKGIKSVKAHLWSQHMLEVHPQSCMLADFRKPCTLWATVNFWGWGNDRERNTQSETKACIRVKQQGQLQAWEVEQAVQGTGAKEVTGLMHGIHGCICPSRAIFKRQCLAQAALAKWALLVSMCLGSVPTHSTHPCLLSGPLPDSAPLIPVTALLYNTAQGKTEEEKENKRKWWLVTQTN